MNQRLTATALASVLLVAPGWLAPAGATEYLIESPTELKQAFQNLLPGDSVVLSAGEWRDVKIVFRGQGSPEAPITLRAATPGKTILCGRSTLCIFGDYLEVRGLLFQDPAPGVSDLIQFRHDSDELSHHCRMTECAVVCASPSQEPGESRWVGLYGSDNRLDHCSFTGKADKGATVVVWLGVNGAGRHRIDHNYFGPRERLGKNGGETLRVGDSGTSFQDAQCLIERNLFHRCNGETECVSNKSCGNIYRDNTFLEVSGTLTLRHGNRCLVENNVFLGNRARGTGGIRVVGEDHVIRGNYLENLTGDDARSALTLMTGIPNSPPHRYYQVRRAVLEDNTVVDCEHPILIGLRDDEDATLEPVETRFNNNIVLAPKYEVVEARCSLAGISWRDNHFAGKTLGIPERAGISSDPVERKSPVPVERGEVGPAWEP